MSKLWIDLETWCTVPIAYGMHRYTAAADIMLIAWALDDDPAQVVDVANGEALPPELLDALNDPDVELWAHNSNFDRSVLKKFYPAVADPGRWRDTMVLAYAHSLPGSLSDLCGLLRLPTDAAKDKDGRRLVLLFTKPLGAHSRLERATRDTHPEDWARFVNYARLDVEAMRAVYKRLPKLNDTPTFWQQWHTDQRINDRGFAIDLPLVSAAIEASAKVKEDSDATVRELTGGRVQTVGQCNELIKFLCDEYGVTLPDFQRSTLERRVSDESIPAPVRTLIATRLAAAKASTKKFEALDKATSADGRLRGCLQFCGAGRTGRWTGRTFQPQNLPRGTMKPDAVEEGIKALKAGLAPVLYDDVNTLVSNCVRGAVIAPEGKRLVVADLSNIEGRMLAWLAGEEWKLEAFRAFDRGEGPDLYKATYGRTFGVNPEDVTKGQRQIGKVLELAMGYQGGVGAFLTFATAYRVDLEELAVHAREAVAPVYMREAEDFYEWAHEKGLTSGVSQNVYIACDAIKRAWRAAHPAITGFWAGVDRATADVIAGNVEVARAGRVAFAKRGPHLCVRLPSGRFMLYPAARLPREDERATFCYWGQYQASKKWGYVRTYAGKVVENITQAAARDVLANGIELAEAKGYDIVMHVHDELIAEVPDDGTRDEVGLGACMSTVPVWADGLPLAAAGFCSYRYRKD